MNDDVKHSGTKYLNLAAVKVCFYVTGVFSDGEPSVEYKKTSIDIRIIHSTSRQSL